MNEQTKVSWRPTDEIHVPTVHRKASPGYRDNEGRDHAARLLYIYECQCGWRGACWYASRDRARAHWERHLEGVVA